MWQTIFWTGVILAWPVGAFIYGGIRLHRHPEERARAREMYSGPDSWGTF